MTAHIDPAEMRSAAGQACRLMKVLANPDRLMVLCQLAEGERRVGELEELLGIVQPTLSQQLTILRDESLVSTRRDGKNIYYQLTSPQAAAVMKVLYEQFCKPVKSDPA
ncbi:MAG: metalloregulator ArsR/SmtB family transcription factor [Pseudomonadota bacterium]